MHPTTIGNLGYRPGVISVVSVLRRVMAGAGMQSVCHLEVLWTMKIDPTALIMRSLVL